MGYKPGDEPVPGYRLVKSLGQGGFGEVWKAVSSSGIECALKVIALGTRQGIKEYRALSLFKNLHQANLNPITQFWLKSSDGQVLYEIGDDEESLLQNQGGELLVAMTLGDQNLHDRLLECQKQGKEGIPPEELLEHIEGAAKALDYLNIPTSGSKRKAIQHCDVKPQNMLLVGGAVQVCDYGLAKAMGTGESMTAQQWTVAYVAPEYVMENGKPSATTDQYSLAVSYHELRTGQLPFPDGTRQHAMLLAKTQGKLDISRLPPREQAIIRRATDLDPTKRYSSCLEMVKELRKAYEGSSTGSGAPKPVSLVDLQPGQELLPQYKLLRKLGQGGYGEVWEARAPGGILVAMKIIKDLGGSPGKQELNALELIKSVQHLHLLELHGYWLIDANGMILTDEMRERSDCPDAEVLVIVCRKADESLLDRLESYRQQDLEGIPPEELLEYMRQAAKAVDYLNAPQHEFQGRRIAIQHRDIKPENLLLVHQVIKVANFGLAKVLEGTSAVVHGTSAGCTPPYAAPELWKAQVSPTTDQYALALTYFKLRTGILPFAGKTSQFELMVAHTEGRLDLSRLPDAEQEVIRKATAIHPEARFPTCSDMVIALDAAMHPDRPATRAAPLRSEMPTIGRITLGSSSPLEEVSTTAELAVADVRVQEKSPATRFPIPTQTVTLSPTGPSAWREAPTDSSFVRRPSWHWRIGCIVTALALVLLALCVLLLDPRGLRASASAVLSADITWAIAVAAILLPTVWGLTWLLMSGLLRILRLSQRIHSNAREPAQTKRSPAASSPPGRPPTRRFTGAFEGQPADFGSYRILAVLGRGSAGVVYHAKHKETGREVALKVLPGALFAGQEAIQRTLRQAHIGGSLSHPNICALVDAGVEAGDVYVAAEYLQGQTLDRVLEAQGPLPVARTSQLGGQLLQGLQYLASRFIVHRDIKPANLLVDENGQLKILDLGLAKDWESAGQFETLDPALQGTPAYMAPEQISGVAVTDRADLYAAGVTLFELVTGHKPFEASAVYQLLLDVTQAPPPDPRSLQPALPETLALLILRLLDKEPAKRPSHEEALATLALLTGESLQAQSAPVSGSSVPDVERKAIEANLAAAVAQAESRPLDVLDCLPVQDGRPLLGIYFLAEQLGQKAAIKTYRATHSLTGAEAIVRLLPPAFDQLAPREREMLLAQSGRLMRLTQQNPNLVRLLNVDRATLTRGNFRTVYYTVEDYLNGSTFEQLVRASERMPPARARQCLTQAITALAALHDNQLVHGNLHAGKVYFDDATKQCHIADLSHVRQATPDVRATAPGNREIKLLDWRVPGASRKQYQAPEVFDEGVTASPLTDQFALGVTFLEALAGRFVRTDPNKLKCLLCVRADLESILADLRRGASGLAEILERMVRTSPEQRFPESRELLQALQERRKPGREHSHYDVFISYRRIPDGPTARLLGKELEVRGVRCFLDIERLDAGRFPEKLLRTIQGTPNFFVILSDGCLGRCGESDDWLRREIAHAIQTRRNIVPILMPRFDWPKADHLPSELQSLNSYQGVQYTNEFFEGFIDRLKGMLQQGRKGEGT